MEALLPLFPPDKSPYHWEAVAVIHPTSAVFLAMNCVVQAVVFGVLGMRFYSRLTTSSLGWDDWLTLFATGLTTGSLIASICFCIIGCGYPAAEVAINLSTIFLLLFIIQPLFIFGIAATKISVCCFYLRVFVGRGMRIATFVTIGLVCAWVAGLSLAAIFICTPISGAFDLRLAAVVKCGDQAKFFQSAIIINVVLDIIIIVLPLWTIWSLNMRTSDKVGLYAAFSISIGMVIVGIIRAILVVQTSYTGDFTATAPVNVFLIVFEQQLGVIVISIPMLRPLWARYRSRSTGYNLGDNDNNNKNSGSGRAGGRGAGSGSGGGGEAEDGSELVTFGGTGGSNKKTSGRHPRDMHDSILNTQLDGREVETTTQVGKSAGHNSSGDAASDAHSTVSDWVSRGDSGSESRLDVTLSQQHGHDYQS